MVEGEYQARDGDIIEIRTGGSWKNDYRHLYVIHEGEEVEIGHITDPYAKSEVKKYLRGKIAFEDIRCVAKRIKSTENPTDETSA